MDNTGLGAVAVKRGPCAQPNVPGGDASGAETVACSLTPGLRLYRLYGGSVAGAGAGRQLPWRSGQPEGGSQTALPESPCYPG